MVVAACKTGFKNLQRVIAVCIYLGITGYYRVYYLGTVLQGITGYTYVLYLGITGYFTSLGV